MPRNITVTFDDGTTHVYQNAPDNITPDQVSARAQQDFGKAVKALDGGRKPAPKPAAKPQGQSWGDSLANSAREIGGSLIAGAAYLPDIAAQGGDAVTHGVTNALASGGDAVLRAFGANGVADKFNTVMQRGMAPTPTAGGKIDQAMPDTEVPYARLMAQLLGGALVPVGPKVTPPVKFPKPQVAAPVSAAQQVVKDAGQAGVRVMTSDVKPPRTFIGKTLQVTGERIIGTGTGGMRRAQNQQRVAAVQDLLKAHGADEHALDAVTADLAATRGGMIEKLTAAKNKVIGAFTGPVAAPQAIKAIDDQIARLKGINSDAFAPVIGKLEEFKAQLSSGKTLEQIEGNRRLLGDLFKDPSLASISGDGQKALNAIYGPLRSDMGNFIRANGGDAMFNRWKSANDQLSAMAGELSNTAFKNVLRDAEATPEKVAGILFSKRPSDVRRLVANLSPEGRAKAQAALLWKAAGETAENVSPDKFKAALTRMSGSTGVAFQGADLVRLEGLHRVLQATSRAAEAAVSPPTGVQNAMAGIYGGAGVLGGLKGLIAVQGYGLLARAYESAPVRNMLLKIGRAKPDSRQELDLMRNIAGALAGMAESNPGMARGMAHLNDNYDPRLAAEKQQEQQPPLQP